VGGAGETRLSPDGAGLRVPSLAVNIGNLPRPGPDGAPAQLHHSQVLTFFHEFGHVRVQRVAMDGVAVPPDPLVRPPGDALHVHARRL
jgi:Zn-dependent oligopeptidase